MITYKNVNIILILSLIVFILLKLVFNISFSYYWLLLLVLIWFIFTTIGSFHIRWNYYIDAKHKNERIAENAIAISFDDGPNREFTPKVLALLKEYKAKATFFLLEEILKRIQICYNKLFLKDIQLETIALAIVIFLDFLH